MPQTTTPAPYPVVRAEDYSRCSTCCRPMYWGQLLVRPLDAQEPYELVKIGDPHWQHWDPAITDHSATGPDLVGHEVGRSMLYQTNQPTEGAA